MAAKSKALKKINEDYSIDSATVYFKGKPIPNSHAPSFQVLKESPYYAKDRNQVYSCRSYYRDALVILEDADPASFLSLGWNEFGTDRDTLYYCGDKSNYQEIWNRLYRKLKTKAISINEFTEQADDRLDWISNKFADLTGYWWNDDYDKKAESANPLSFAYSRSKSAVFIKLELPAGHGFYQELIHGADPDTFVSLNATYARDRQHIFWQQHKVIGADPQTFRALDEDYGMDQTQAYYRYGRIKDAEITCFQVLGNQYARDVASLYYGHIGRENPHDLKIYRIVHGRATKINGGDPSNFKILSKSYAKDLNQVYIYGSRITKAHAPSFEFLFRDDYNDWARDKHCLYGSNGWKIYNAIDGATFQVLDRFYGKDECSVFSFATQRVLKKADAKSFVVVPNSGYAQDNHHYYSAGSPISSSEFASGVNKTRAS